MKQKNKQIYNRTICNTSNVKENKRHIPVDM